MKKLSVLLSLSFLFTALPAKADRWFDGTLFTISVYTIYEVTFSASTLGDDLLIQDAVKNLKEARKFIVISHLKSPADAEESVSEEFLALMQVERENGLLSNQKIIKKIVSDSVAIIERLAI